MYNGRTVPASYPPAKAVQPPSYREPLLKSVEARAVRSETELRQAILDVQLSQPTIEARSEFDSQLIRRSSAIEIAAPFIISSLVTIPDECFGLEIYSAGFNPIGFADGVDVCFAVYAQGVRLRNVIQYVPQGATPPSVFADLYGATGFEMLGCWCGGSTAVLRTPSGADASDYLRIDGYRGDSSIDLSTSRSKFVGCDFNNVTISGTRNRFGACTLDDITEATGSDFNVAAGCIISGSTSPQGSSSRFDTTYANAPA